MITHISSDKTTRGLDVEALLVLEEQRTKALRELRLVERRLEIAEKRLEVRREKEIARRKKHLSFATQVGLRLKAELEEIAHLEEEVGRTDGPELRLEALSRALREIHESRGLYYVLFRKEQDAEEDVDWLKEEVTAKKAELRRINSNTARLRVGDYRQTG
jgi:hypothetical protein